YPSSIYPSSIYPNTIYDPQDVYYEEDVKKILEEMMEDVEKLSKYFDRKMLQIERKMGDIGKKSFVLGTAIALRFADDRNEGRIYRKGYFDRAVIMTHEEEKYKKFVDKMKNLPKIKHAINPNISIYKQLPDTKKAQKDKTNILKRVELVREYKKDLSKSKTDYTYTIPKTKSGRGLGTRVAQAVDIAN